MCKKYKEVKRKAKVGDKIKVIKGEPPRLGGPIPYPLNSIWTVKKVFNEELGIVYCFNNGSGISVEEYVVLEHK
ncbi:hypothetical protein [Shouchella clausii]|uniref:hypothetical protein n=1 Tax=Shouchella clausii TaxID=79880 RepID=UPI001652CBF7|nr:hypothetical protein [Shouchella clausii]QNM43759.1 hypothetical protein DUT88_13015 [Shouchella clausii]